MAFEFIDTELAQRQLDNGWRSRQARHSPQGRFCQRRVDGQTQTWLNFSSNDYLGLASQPELVDAWQQGARRYGVGSGGSALVSGYDDAHHQLEQTICQWTGQPACLLFNSGYSANQAVLKALMKPGQHLFQDRLNHASLMEAGMMLDVRMSRFKHNDVDSLATALDRSQRIDADADRLVVTEGVFSMDGDQAPLAAISQACSRHKAWLMVDDAHGIGVLGQNGFGSAEAAGLSASDVQIHMATFGKAIGVSGAFVAGSQALIDYLVNFSRPYIYTTAMPGAMAYTISAGLELARTQSWRRQHLQALIEHFRRICEQAGIPLGDSQTPIQPVMLGSNERALHVAGLLSQAQIWAVAIRPPTVPKGSARLRLTLTAEHQHADLERLVAVLKEALDAAA